jgi:hypothetical protein
MDEFKDIPSPYYRSGIFQIHNNNEAKKNDVSLKGAKVFIVSFGW